MEKGSKVVKPRPVRSLNNQRRREAKIIRVHAMQSLCECFGLPTTDVLAARFVDQPVTIHRTFTDEK